MWITSMWVISLLLLCWPFLMPSTFNNQSTSTIWRKTAISINILFTCYFAEKEGSHWDFQLIVTSPWILGDIWGCGDGIQNIFIYSCGWFQSDETGLYRLSQKKADPCLMSHKGHQKWTKYKSTNTKVLKKSGNFLSNEHYQLLFDQMISAPHWPTVLLIGQLMSAAHWPLDDSCSLANWCQLLIGQMCCSLAKWC